MPTGVLRPRIKCGAVKLTSDRALQTDKVLSYCFANKRTSTASRSRAASCSVVSWGFGFRRTRLWARPRPGALVGALVMPRKIWSGPVSPPPRNFPGWPWHHAYQTTSGPGPGPGAKLEVGRWTLGPPDHGPHPAQPRTQLQLLTEPRGRTAANTAASGPSDRAAGRRPTAYRPLTDGLIANR
jgi:hypothetical protein